MPVQPTRLLVINRQVQFSTKIKKTLEQIGGYEVASFTTAEAALDYLEAHPQHVALVDYNLKGTSGVELILRLREAQPDLAIVLTPKFPATEAAARDFDLQGAVDTTISARELVGVLGRAVTSARDSLPDTSAAAPLFEPDTRLMAGSAAALASDSLADAPATDSASEAEDSAEADEMAGASSVFAQLAAEEPPMPDLEGGTIHDLGTGMADSGVREVVEILRDNDQLIAAEPLPYEDGDDAESPSLARQLLQGMAGAEGDLASLLAELQDTGAIQLDPADLSATGRMIEVAASAEEEMHLLLNAPPVIPPPPDVPIAPPPDAHFDAAEPAPSPHADEALPLDAAPPERQPAPFADAPAIAPPPLAERDRLADTPNTALARLALTLTQASLELAADETLLTQDGQIIAYAGKLAAEDLETLHDAIGGDWDAQPGQARIRFVNLPSSGQDYMLFSSRTGLTGADDDPALDGARETPPTEDFTLTMVFGGNMPLQAIRRQTDRLLRALNSVPEPESELPGQDDDWGGPALDTPIAPPPDFDPAPLDIDDPADADLARYAGPPVASTLIWTLADDVAPLDDTARGLLLNLDGWLIRRGWTMGTLNIYDRVVYLHALLPDDLPPYVAVAALKRASARMLGLAGQDTDPSGWWDDAYIALVPGRELTPEEVERFIALTRRESRDESGRDPRLEA